MMNWNCFCGGALKLSVAILVLSLACFLPPAIARSIDRAVNVDSIMVGVQFNYKTGVFYVGFSAQNINNIKSHLLLE